MNTSSIVRLLEENRLYLACLAVLFVVEALLSMWTGLPYDMKVWFQTGQWMSQGINIYQPNNHIGYPPLWALWCLFAYRSYVVFGSLEFWRFVLKLPLIIAHLLLSCIVGRFVAKEFGGKNAFRLFVIVLTWSFLIYIGALWGQINTLSALLTFLAFEAMVNQRTVRSAAFLGTSVALKIFPLVTFPAFIAYVLKRKGKKEAGKFSLWVAGVPVIFTLSVFMVFHWDILYFIKTVFYWTPVFATNAPQVQSGLMNLWSFLSLFGIDVGNAWLLRLVWVPVLLGGAIYWFRKSNLDNAGFNLSVITLYLLFMMTYGWVTEQMFVDPLPFIFLQIFCYRPKKSHFYLLVMIQVLIFVFSAVNYGGTIFEPLLTRFSPSALRLDQSFYAIPGPLLQARGLLGVTISLFLAIFIVILMKGAAKSSEVHPHRLGG
jgi:hypothetical protein